MISLSVPSSFYRKGLHSQLSTQRCLRMSHWYHMSSFIKIELKTLVGLPCSPILSLGFYPLTPAKNLGHIPNLSISHRAVFRGKALIPPLILIFEIVHGFHYHNSDLDDLHFDSSLWDWHPPQFYCLLLLVCVFWLRKPPVAKDNYLGLYLLWTSRWVLPFSWNLSQDSDWSESILVSSFSLAVLLLRPMRNESILRKLFLPP